MGLQLWCWNQTTILALEESCFALPQESTEGMLVSERNAACFFDHWGIVLYEFPPECQTTNQYFYPAVLRRHQDAVWRKWPEMWTVGSWLLHHDNALAHTALSIRQFLAKHSIGTLPQHPYSPDLSPPDFFLVPKLKITLEEDFTWWKPSSLMRQMTWKWYYKHHLNSASKSAHGGGRGALLRKGTLLRGIIFNKL
jgi:hypothetical protein